MDLQPISLVLCDISFQYMDFSGRTEGGRDGSAQQLADIIKYGVVIVSKLPIMAVYPFIQKYFSILIGSIKG